LDSGQIKQWAGEVGFDLVGIAPAAEAEHGDSLREWLGRGCHGGMQYMERNLEKRVDVTQLMPGARSVVCVALSYYQPGSMVEADGDIARVARYAWGLDYHDVMRGKLKQLAERMYAGAAGVKLRCFVDTAPLLEKAHAARAGLGWIGKNTLLINGEFGSWLVLGEIVTDLELDYDEPVEPGCGDCRRCLDACPTAALVGPYSLDARACISYLTVESRCEVPAEFAAKMGGRLFGCDACQESCPHNERPKIGKACEFEAEPRWAQPRWDELEQLSEAEYHERFAGGSIARADYDHFMSIVRGRRR
jgi:epoxyqueuosine reductase